MYLSKPNNDGAVRKSAGLVAPVKSFPTMYYRNGQGDGNKRGWSPPKEGRRHSRCNWCGKDGHTDPNCWIKNKACFICGGEGHFARTCSQRKTVVKLPDVKCPRCAGPHLGVNCRVEIKPSPPLKEQALS